MAGDGRAPPRPQRPPGDLAGPPAGRAPPAPDQHPALTTGPGRGGLEARLSSLWPYVAYAAYRTADVLARALPPPAGETLFTGLALLAHAVLPERRAVVAANLRRVNGPEPSGGEIDEQTKAAFVSYARYWLESFRLPGTGADELDAHLSYEGLEHLEEAYGRGNGVIMALPHVGNWDFGGSWLASVGGYPVMVVAEPVRPPALFDWFTRLRRSLGMELVPLGPEAGTAVLRWLRAGKLVGLLCDRDIMGGGVEVEFFGERTTLPSGPATLALRAGAAVLPTVAYFEERGRYHGVVRPPLSLERTGRFRDDVGRITQELAREFEVLIRRAPEQWHMFQPNWPSDRAKGR